MSLSLYEASQEGKLGQQYIFLEQQYIFKSLAHVFLFFRFFVLFMMKFIHGHSIECFFSHEDCMHS